MTHSPAQMYTTYFGFREQPFNLTPTSHFFYTNPVYQEAYAKLLGGIYERKGLMVLTGEVGTGKTTLLRRLMNQLDSDATVRFAFCYYTTLTFEELLSFICEELGLTVEDEGHLQTIQVLIEFLRARSQEGEIIALLIDEAQGLQENVLEDLLLLSGPQAANEKLLQIILVGQHPELDEKLGLPRLSQLKQCITLRCQLEHLKKAEVNAFIHHRLRVAGYERQDLFSSEALQLISVYSKGIPRLINLICDNALRLTSEASQKTVSAEIIQKVAQNLRLQEESTAAPVELQEVEALSRNGQEASSPEFSGEPPQHTQGFLSLVRGEASVQAFQALKTELLQRVSKRLAWLGGTGILLAFLGLAVFLFIRRAERETVWAPASPAALVQCDSSSHTQSPLLPDGQPFGQSAERGKTVLESIVRKHQDVQPVVWGLATATPAVALILPETEWNQLSKDDQLSLVLYMENLIPTVRANPDQYIDGFRTVPVYEAFRTKVANLCVDCWVIGVGHRTSDKRSLLFDKVVVQGDSMWEKTPAYYQGIKASTLRAELKTCQSDTR